MHPLPQGNKNPLEMVMHNNTIEKEQYCSLFRMNIIQNPLLSCALHLELNIKPELTAFTNYCNFTIAISEMKFTLQKKYNPSTRLSVDFRTTNRRNFIWIISKWRHILINKMTNQLHWWKLKHAFTSSPEMNIRINGKWKLNFSQSVWFILLPLLNIRTKLIQWNGDRAAVSRKLVRKWMQEGTDHNLI